MLSCLFMAFLRNSWLLTELVKQPPSENDANPNHFGVRPGGEGEGESGETGNKRWSQTVVLEENLDRAGGRGGGVGGKTARLCMVSMWEKSTYLN